MTPLLSVLSFSLVIYPIQEEQTNLDFKNDFLTSSEAGHGFSASPAHSLPIRFP